MPFTDDGSPLSLLPTVAVRLPARWRASPRAPGRLDRCLPSLSRMAAGAPSTTTSPVRVTPVRRAAAWAAVPSSTVAPASYASADCSLAATLVPAPSAVQPSATDRGVLLLRTLVPAT